MSNLRTKTAYPLLSGTDAWSARVFWVLALFSVLSLAAYVQSVYSTVDLSYKIEKELQLMKKDTVVYRELEGRYALRLESLVDEGRKTLGLDFPKRQTFVERNVAVARAGL